MSPGSVAEGRRRGLPLGLAGPRAAYGIPAVVGVVGATELIATGQRLTVDGSGGSITLEDGG